jgi:Ser/Thr protein kinase RdoA (MazF antagonist)
MAREQTTERARTAAEFMAREADDLGEVARAALARFGLPGDSPIELINHTENLTYRVEQDGGPGYALRLHREHYQSRANIESEFAWVDALREAGIRTPIPVPGTDGGVVQTVSHPSKAISRHCDLQIWEPGEHLNPKAMETLVLLGELNARIHEQARQWKRPQGFIRQAWDADGLLGAHPIWGRFEDLAGLAPEAIRQLGQARDRARAELVAFGKNEDRFGLIHADLLPQNVLVHEGSPMVIDFDDSGFSWRLYDLATVLNYDVAEDRLEAMQASWLEGYRRVAPMPDAHLAHLPALITARHLISLGWLETRSETLTAAEGTQDFIELALFWTDRYLGS